MQKAFIIMPFDPSMQEIYANFIKSTLEELGYQVERADDIRSGQNILDDVIKGISEANLIVADLSGGNENVFYELGIAHALDKPTILLTEKLDDVPFDLQSYRMIGYDTHFSKISEAKEQLAKIAKGAFENNIPFSNPVRDYFRKHTHPDEIPPSIEEGERRPDAVDVKESAEVEKGLYDYLADVEESSEVFANFLNEAGEVLTKFTDEMLGATKSLSSDQLPLKQRREIVRRLTKPTSDVYSYLRENNPKIRNQIGLFETGLTFFLNNIQGSSEKIDEGVWDSFVLPMKTLQSSIKGGKTGVNELTMTMMSLPSIQGNFDHARKAMTDELIALSENFDQLDSILTRTISLAENVRKSKKS